MEGRGLEIAMGMLKENDKRFIDMPNDVKKIIVIYLLSNPLYILNLIRTYYNVNGNGDKNDLHYKIIENLIIDNQELFEIFWLKYLASKLPTDENGNKFGVVILRELFYYGFLYGYNNITGNVRIDIDVDKNSYNFNRYTSPGVAELVNQNIKLKPIILDVAYKNTKECIKLIKKLQTSTEINEISKNIIYLETIFDGKTIIVHAAENKNYNVVKMLIEKGANVNIEPPGTPPLYYAVWHGNINMSKLLIDNGANVNFFINSQQTYLQIAIIDNNLEMVRFLLNNGADATLSKDKNSNPIFLAAQANVSILRLILKQNVDINLQNRTGDTPLYIATGFMMHKNVAELIKHNANPLIKNKLYKTPLDAAISTGDSSLINVLRKYTITYSQNLKK